MTPILLVAHGSRDRRAAATIRALVRAVAAARPGVDVRAAFLDHTAPTVGAALRALAGAGHREAVVVPLLLTEAYHGRVDVPAVLAEARAAGLAMTVHRSQVIGSPRDPLLVSGLRRRLADQRRPYDAVVLAAAGTRDSAARDGVAAVARALAQAVGVPCLAGYAAAAGPTVAEAARALQVGATGATRRVLVASYFLAPGLLHDRALASAFSAGAVGASAPLGAAPELAELVLSRADAAVGAAAGAGQRR